MHDSNEEAPIYRDREGDGEEYRRAMAHACTGLRPDSPAAFDPGESTWGVFYSNLFASELAPHFVACYNAAIAGQSAALETLEEQFSRRLPEDARARLVEASPAVFEARSGAAALKLLDRLADRDAGCTFTTAFATHAASFHVPLLHALIAYLAAEWRAGECSPEGLEKTGSWRTMFERQLLNSPEPVRQILARNLCNWAEVA
jgi:hypothetical protein